MVLAMLVDDVLDGLRLITLSHNYGPMYKKTYPLFHKKILAASRFNLSDNVVKAVSNLVATKASHLMSYLEFAKRPAKIFWVEFPVKPRTELLHQLGVIPDGKHPSRVGLLVDDHPEFPNDLLCGRAVVCWRHNGEKYGESGYTELLWNFREDWTDWRTAEEKQRHAKIVVTRSSNVAWLYRNQPSEIAAHTTLMARYEVLPCWLHMDFLDHYLGQMNDKQASQFIANSKADASSEGTMLLAILILFNARKTLEYEDVNYDKLNKSRTKSGKTPLLAHKNVNFYLSSAKRRSYNAKGMTVEQGVVLQRVIGHFRSRYSTRRGTREIFWVEPFERGDAIYGLGPSITHMKTVKL